ncbi:hypothetical protein CBA19CS42_30420 [Caballeronia novacaledonica]|uniref:Uncharacterized protein n=1 Tax=Caballeronia novacaledonica TaxID=1544861 RepID=A0AA37IFV9_9BURK|nr:hypothetical protein CBA19CS42_30420 [Caballeronia novacaledonica]
MFVVDIEYLGAHPADNDNFNNTNRVTNAIKFTSPTIDGFTFGGMCSLSGVAGDVTRNQIWPLGGGYGGLELISRRYS